jgi:hypothetical protein
MQFACIDVSLVARVCRPHHACVVRMWATAAGPRLPVPAKPQWPFGESRGGDRTRRILQRGACGAKWLLTLTVILGSVRARIERALLPPFHGDPNAARSLD